MAMQPADIEALIKAALPDAQVTIEDLAGDGDHYAATVVSEAFKGKSRVQQHQIVYAALRGPDGGRVARPGAADLGAGLTGSEQDWDGRPASAAPQSAGRKKR